MREQIFIVARPVRPLTGPTAPLCRAKLPGHPGHEPFAIRAAHLHTELMWMLRATVVVSILLAGVCGVIGAAAEGFTVASINLDVGPAASVPHQPLALAVAGTLVGLGWAVTGAVLAWLRSANPVGWMLLAVGTLTQFSMTEEAMARAGWLTEAAVGVDWSGRAVGLALSLATGWAIMTMLGVLPAIYPDGRLPSHGWLWPAITVAVGAALVQVQWFFTEATGKTAAGAPDATAAGRDADAAAAAAANLPTAMFVALPTLIFFAGAATLWVMCVVLLFRSQPPKRQQLAWLLGSVVVLLIVNLLGDSLLMQTVQVTSLYVLPLAIAIALLRYQLLGIDAAPHADPMRTVAEIGSHFASSEEGELLGAVLASVQRSVRAPGARVHDETGAVVASVGDPAPPGFTTNLAVGGVHVGVLEVAARWPGDRYAARDERMLRSLAAQIAAVVRSQRLTEQIEAQRDAVIDARVQERERLRRELHDGLGPALTGIGLGLEGLTSAVVADDNARALDIAGVLREEVSVTVSEVRRVLDDLRPVALDEAGFAEALRRSVAAVATTVPVDVRIGELPILPLAIEQAAYRITGEAVTNALRHAQAMHLDVEVGATEEYLTVRVCDDGIGFDSVTALPGIGLASMRDRARALGGKLTVSSAHPSGTTVILELPIGVALA